MNILLIFAKQSNFEGEDAESEEFDEVVAELKEITEDIGITISEE